jgi:hypothetical protein
LLINDKGELKVGFSFFFFFLPFFFESQTVVVVAAAAADCFAFRLYIPLLPCWPQSAIVYFSKLKRNMPPKKCLGSCLPFLDLERYYYFFRSRFSVRIE